jgi:TetR/AcrR family transcriptional regulator, transcriptional repressor for nem operon
MLPPLRQRCGRSSLAAACRACAGKAAQAQSTSNVPAYRLIAYIEFRKAILTGDLPDFTCFAGTIVQEAYRTHPDVSAACERNITGHAKTLEADIRAAMRDHGARGTWTPESLALHIQAVIQGSFILAKAKGSAAVAAESLDHLRRYLELLFGSAGKRRTNRAPSRKH